MFGRRDPTSAQQKIVNRETLLRRTNTLDAEVSEHLLDMPW